MERFAIKIDENVRSSLYKICRLCGIDNPNKVPILENVLEINVEEKKDVDGEAEMAKKIFDCVGVQVTKVDRMPQCICSLCYDKVNDFYEFREMCLSTNIQTRRLLGLPDMPDLPKIEMSVSESILGLDLERKSPVKPILIEAGNSSRRKRKKSNLPIVNNPAVKQIRTSRSGSMTPSESKIDKELKVEKLKNTSRRGKNVKVEKNLKSGSQKITNQPNLKRELEKSKKSSQKSKNFKPDVKTELKENKMDNSTVLKDIKSSEDKRILKQSSVELSLAAKKRKLLAKKRAYISTDVRRISLRNRSLTTEDSEKDLQPLQGKQICEICQNEFENSSFLEDHLQSVHVPNIVPYHCIYCSETIFNKMDIKNHNLWHKLSKTPYSCGRCDKMLETLIGYTKHIHECSPFRKTIPTAKRCEKCNREFETQNLFNLHDCVANSRVCPKCTRVLPKKSDIKKHVVRCSGLAKKTTKEVSFCDDIILLSPQRSLPLPIKEESKELLKVSKEKPTEDPPPLDAENNDSSYSKLKNASQENIQQIDNFLKTNFMTMINIKQEPLEEGYNSESDIPISEIRDSLEAQIRISDIRVKEELLNPDNEDIDMISADVSNKELNPALSKPTIKLKITKELGTLHVSLVESPSDLVPGRKKKKKRKKLRQVSQGLESTSCVDSPENETNLYKSSDEGPLNDSQENCLPVFDSAHDEYSSDGSDNSKNYLNNDSNVTIQEVVEAYKIVPTTSKSTPISYGSVPAICETISSESSGDVVAKCSERSFDLLKHNTGDLFPIDRKNLINEGNLIQSSSNILLQVNDNNKSEFVANSKQDKISIDDASLTVETNININNNPLNNLNETSENSEKQVNHIISSHSLESLEQESNLVKPIENITVKDSYLITSSDQDNNLVKAVKETTQVHDINNSCLLLTKPSLGDHLPVISSVSSGVTADVELKTYTSDNLLLPNIIDAPQGNNNELLSRFSMPVIGSVVGGFDNIGIQCKNSNALNESVQKLEDECLISNESQQKVVCQNAVTEIDTATNFPSDQPHLSEVFPQIAVDNISTMRIKQEIVEIEIEKEMTSENSSGFERENYPFSYTNLEDIVKDENKLSPNKLKIRSEGDGRTCSVEIDSFANEENKDEIDIEEIEIAKSPLIKIKPKLIPDAECQCKRSEIHVSSCSDQFSVPLIANVIGGFIKEEDEINNTNDEFAPPSIKSENDNPPLIKIEPKLISDGEYQYKKRNEIQVSSCSDQFSVPLIANVIGGFIKGEDEINNTNDEFAPLSIKSENDFYSNTLSNSAEGSKYFDGVNNESGSRDNSSLEENEVTVPLISNVMGGFIKLETDEEVIEGKPLLEQNKVSNEFTSMAFNITNVRSMAFENKNEIFNHFEIETNYVNNKTEEELVHEHFICGVETQRQSEFENYCSETEIRSEPIFENYYPEVHINANSTKELITFPVISDVVAGYIKLEEGLCKKVDDIKNDDDLQNGQNQIYEQLNKISKSPLTIGKVDTETDDVELTARVEEYAVPVITNVTGGFIKLENSEEEIRHNLKSIRDVEESIVFDKVHNLNVNISNDVRNLSYEQSPDKSNESDESSYYDTEIKIEEYSTLDCNNEIKRNLKIPEDQLKCELESFTFKRIKLTLPLENELNLKVERHSDLEVRTYRKDDLTPILNVIGTSSEENVLIKEELQDEDFKNEKLYVPSNSESMGTDFNTTTYKEVDGNLGLVLDFKTEPSLKLQETVYDDLQDKQIISQELLKGEYEMYENTQFCGESSPRLHRYSETENDSKVDNSENFVKTIRDGQSTNKPEESRSETVVYSQKQSIYEFESSDSKYMSDPVVNDFPMETETDTGSCKEEFEDFANTDNGESGPFNDSRCNIHSFLNSTENLDEVAECMLHDKVKSAILVQSSSVTVGLIPKIENINCNFDSVVKEEFTAEVHADQTKDYKNRDREFYIHSESNCDNVDFVGGVKIIESKFQNDLNTCNNELLNSNRETFNLQGELSSTLESTKDDYPEFRTGRVVNDSYQQDQIVKEEYHDNGEENLSEITCLHSENIYSNIDSPKKFKMTGNAFQNETNTDNNDAVGISKKSIVNTQNKVICKFEAVEDNLKSTSVLNYKKLSVESDGKQLDPIGEEEFKFYETENHRKASSELYIHSNKILNNENLEILGNISENKSKIDKDEAMERSVKSVVDVQNKETPKLTDIESNLELNPILKGEILVEKAKVYIEDHQRDSIANKEFEYHENAYKCDKDLSAFYIGSKGSCRLEIIEGTFLNKSNTCTNKAAEKSRESDVNVRYEAMDNNDHVHPNQAFEDDSTYVDAGSGHLSDQSDMKELDHYEAHTMINITHLESSLQQSLERSNKSENFVGLNTNNNKAVGSLKKDEAKVNENKVNDHENSALSSIDNVEMDLVTHSHRSSMDTAKKSFESNKNIEDDIKILSTAKVKARIESNILEDDSSRLQDNSSSYEQTEFNEQNIKHAYPTDSNTYQVFRNISDHFKQITSKQEQLNKMPSENSQIMQCDVIYKTKHSKRDIVNLAREHYHGNETVENSGFDTKEVITPLNEDGNCKYFCETPIDSDKFQQQANDIFTPLDLSMNILKSKNCVKDTIDVFLEYEDKNNTKESCDEVGDNSKSFQFINENETNIQTIVIEDAPIDLPESFISNVIEKENSLPISLDDNLSIKTKNFDQLQILVVNKTLIECNSNLIKNKVENINDTNKCFSGNCDESKTELRATEIFDVNSSCDEYIKFRNWKFWQMVKHHKVDNVTSISQDVNNLQSTIVLTTLNKPKESTVMILEGNEYADLCNKFENLNISAKDIKICQANQKEIVEIVTKADQNETELNENKEKYIFKLNETNITPKLIKTDQEKDRTNSIKQEEADSKKDHLINKRLCSSSESEDSHAVKPKVALQLSAFQDKESIGDSKEICYCKRDDGNAHDKVLPKQINLNLEVTENNLAEGVNSNNDEEVVEICSQECSSSSGKIRECMLTEKSSQFIKRDKSVNSKNDLHSINESTSSFPPICAEIRNIENIAGSSTGHPLRSSFININEIAENNNNANIEKQQHLLNIDENSSNSLHFIAQQNEVEIQPLLEQMESNENLYSQEEIMIQIDSNNSLEDG